MSVVVALAVVWDRSRRRPDASLRQSDLGVSDWYKMFDKLTNVCGWRSALGQAADSGVGQTSSALDSQHNAPVK